jgi:hypothetical protein
MTINNFKETGCRTLRNQFRCQCSEIGNKILTGVPTVTIEQIWKDYENNYANNKLDVCPALKQLIHLRTDESHKSTEAKGQ